MGNALIEKMQREPDKKKCVGQASKALCKLAIESFRNAVALKPFHGNAYHNWGAVLNWMGQHDKAINKFIRGYAVSPQTMSENKCSNIWIAIKARDLKEGKFTWANLIDEEKQKRKAFEEINLSEQCVAN